MKKRRVSIGMQTCMWSILAAAVAFFFPLLPVNADITGLQSANIIIIFTIVIAFLISEALQRKQNIESAVDMEINKLRRIFHLSEFLDSGKIFRDWQIRLEKNLSDYLHSFRNSDFKDYATTDEKFRKLTHTVYDVPKLTDQKSISLYAELLRTTSTLSETRQNLRSLTQAGLSSYEWTVMFVLAAGVLFVSGMFTDGTFWTRIMSMMMAVAIVLTIDFLWRLDKPSREWENEISQRYVNTVERLCKKV